MPIKENNDSYEKDGEMKNSKKLSEDFHQKNSKKTAKNSANFGSKNQDYAENEEENFHINSAKKPLKKTHDSHIKLWVIIFLSNAFILGISLFFYQESKKINLVVKNLQEKIFLLENKINFFDYTQRNAKNDQRKNSENENEKNNPLPVLEAMNEENGGTKKSDHETNSALIPLAQAEARIAIMDQKVNFLQNVLAKTQAHSKLSALLMNVTHVRDAIKSGEKFDLELMAISAFFPEDTNIQNYVQKLSPFAQRGLPSISSLKHQFTEIADTIILMNKGENLGNSPQDKIKLWLMNFVKIRNISLHNQNQDQTEMLVARAESLLEDGNLSSAISELKSLTGQAAHAASPWLEDAENVRQAEYNVDQLYSYVTQKMMQETGVVN